MEALLALFFTFGLMWLMLIRPQQRRMRAHQAVVAALEPGDEVVTAGGIHGTITAVDGEDVRMEIAPGVVVRILRGAISQRSEPYSEADDYDEDDDEEAAEVEPEPTRRALDEDGA